MYQKADTAIAIECTAAVLGIEITSHLLQKCKRDPGTEVSTLCADGIASGDEEKEEYTLFDPAVVKNDRNGAQNCDRYISLYYHFIYMDNAKRTLHSLMLFHRVA